LYIPRPPSPKPKEYRDVLIQALPKVGLKTRRRLVEHFGSLVGIANASVDELKAVEGIGQSLADKIHAVFHEGEIK